MQQRYCCCNSINSPSWFGLKMVKFDLLGVGSRQHQAAVEKGRCRWEEVKQKLRGLPLAQEQSGLQVAAVGPQQCPLHTSHSVRGVS